MKLVDSVFYYMQIYYILASVQWLNSLTVNFEISKVSMDIEDCLPLILLKHTIGNKGILVNIEEHLVQLDYIKYIDIIPK